ncbi:hypothetical protein ARMGADRAFT_1026142 [Armillaria gallica]|uniref:Uncharacterized protein n=1 Tax=Armillaria gallica TaxID=47427 RepID=A0A2H3EM13_ARMGA|nr:hypothetical protein ARMGADRAFT_1026142 [Armillaria gallica]
MEFNLTVAVACIVETLVIWDYLISIEDEVGASDSPVSIATLGYFSEFEICSLVRYDLLTSRPRYGPFGPLPTMRSWKGACYLFINPDFLIYVGIQLIVMEGIMVIRAWAIMGRQHRVLWTFLGLLTFSTIASLVIYVLPTENADSTYYFYFLPTVFLEAILFAVVAYHAIKYRRHSTSPQLSCAGISQPRISPIIRLMFEDSILYFVILCRYEELSTFRVQAVSEGIDSEVEEDRSL